MPMSFQHLNIDAIRAALGDRDLAILELEGKINAMLQVPGVKELIEQFNARVSAGQNGGVTVEQIATVEAVKAAIEQARPVEDDPQA